MNSHYKHIIPYLFVLITQVAFGNLEGNFKSEAFCIENGTSINVEAPGDTITANITGGTSVCLNSAKPLITLTGKDGTAPYTFLINLNNIKDTTIATAIGSDKATFTVPTNAAGTYVYTLKKVTDAKNVSQELSEKLTITVNPLPIADFSFPNDTKCSGIPIEFAPSLTGAYTYAWDFGDKLKSTESNPSQAFEAIGTSGTQTFNVKLTITDQSTGCQNSAKKDVTVKKGPDASLNTSTNSPIFFDQKQKIFVNCNATKSSPQFDFVAENASTTKSSNTAYTIDWGDGGIDKLPGTFTSFSHKYQSLGFFDIKLTVTNSTSECSVSKTYKFFNGNSPGGSLDNLANTVDCVPFTREWPVIGTQDNPPGTTYRFSVDDGSPDQTFTHSNLPAKISHTFKQSSCGKPNNKFTITFTIANPCSESAPTLQIQATEKPKADFDINSGSNINLCLNNSVTLTNTSVGSYAIGNSCLSNYDYKWSILPATGWTGNLTNPAINNLVFNTLGDYQIKLKMNQPKSSDSRCTSDSITKTIHVKAPPAATMTGGETVCQNAASPKITFTGSDGIAPYTFTYKINNGLAKTIKTTAGSNTVTLDVTTSSAGTFNFTLVSVQEGSTTGCIQPQTGSAIIIVNPLPTVIFSPGNQTICSGESTQAVSLTSSASGADLKWTTEQPAGIVEPILLSGTNTIPAQVLTNTTNAPISVIYKAKASLSGSASCEGIEFPYTITINPKPVVSESFNDTICSGSAFSFSPINGGSNSIPIGTKYVWSAPSISPEGALTGASGQAISQSVISQTLVNTTSTIPTATYSVTPVANGCSGNPFNVTVSVNQKAIVDQPEDQTLCNKQPSSEIIFSGNIPGTIYRWSTNNVDIGMEESSGSDKIPAFTAKNTGTSPITAIITVKPTYGSGNSNCDGTVQFSITVNPTGQVNNPGNRYACDGQINAVNFTTRNTGGTTTYAWTNSNTSIGIGASGNGNISFEPVSIGNAVLETTITVIPTFTNNGLSCEGAPEEFKISVDPLVISLKSQTNINCFGESTGAVSLDVHGGVPKEVTPGNFDYQYAWKGQSGFTSSQKDLTNIPAGKYDLTVTDNSGCSQPFSVEITEPTPILVSAITTPISYDGANNATIQLSILGGVPPYKTQWSNFATGTFQDNLSAGEYTISVSDSNKCEKSIPVTIAEAPIFRISPELKNVSCFGANDGQIKLNLLGGQEPISFSWSDGSTAGTIRNNIGPGIYKVSIRDATNREIGKTLEILEPFPIELSTNITNILDCTVENGGAIDLSAVGGVPPYSYQWSNGATSEDLLKIQAGKYMVTVTDSAGCPQTATYIVTRPLPIEINVTTKMDYDCASKKIKAICTADVTGGIAPYQLSWSTGTVSGINNEIMETDQSNLVVLDVTDATVCIVNKTFRVDIPDLGVDYQLLDCDQHIYQFNAVVVNDLEKYTYSWDFGDGSGSTIKNPKHAYQAAGSYKVRLTVLSANSCVSEYEQMVNAELPPIVSIDREAKFCEGDSILIYAKGAQTYRWNDGTTGESMQINRDGNYGVTGFSKAGCTAAVKFSASYFDLLNYSIKSDKTEVTVDQNQLHLWSENVPFSNYLWDFGDGLTGQGPDLVHTYDITKDGYFDVKLKVINPSGCIEEDSKRIWIGLTSIPNTFTPNGDGINDFYLEGWKKEIYNRNGILMYEGVAGWDGTHNGKAVANDTYFVVVYDSSESGAKHKTNYVTVIR